MANVPSVYQQCLERVRFLARINEKELDLDEVQKLVVLVSMEMHQDMKYQIEAITQDPENGFDQPIPF